MAFSFRVLQIRSLDYMTNKLKQGSSKAIYRLVAMDLFATESKAFHVAKTFALPHTGRGSWGHGCESCTAGLQGATQAMLQWTHPGVP